MHLHCPSVQQSVAAQLLGGLEYWRFEVKNPARVKVAGFYCCGIWELPEKIFQNDAYQSLRCSRNIEMTPLCKVDVTLPEVRGASGVRDAGGVDEQEGIRSARSSAGCSVWPSACRGRLRTARREAAADLSVAGGFEARGGGQPGFETARPAEQQPSARGVS